MKGAQGGAGLEFDEGFDPKGGILPEGWGTSIVHALLPPVAGPRSPPRCPWVSAWLSPASASAMSVGAVALWTAFLCGH
jgi:hypothetical protein